MARLIALLLMLLVGAPAAAAPWLAPGDERLRRDVERLSAARVISGPINAWPLPTSQLCADLPAGPSTLEAERLRLAAACAAAAERAAEARIASASHAPLLRGFGQAARDTTDVSASVSYDWRRLHVTIGAGRRGTITHIEPSFAALDLDGWAIYGGYVDQWWGPGRETALLLSTNAPPFPKIGLRRTRPRPVDLPLLRALGPVSAEAFVGVLAESRDDFDNPALIGMRVAVAPAAGLEIGFNRALQLCGAGRPCSLGLIADGLIGFGNRDNSGTPNEPGNQLAGVDFAYRRNVGALSAEIYGEAAAEDENNVLIEQFARLAGVALAGPLGSSGTSWHLHGEAVDTLGVKLFGRKRYPGSFYNHSIYSEGYRYRHRALGSSLDGDGRMFALSASLSDSRDHRVHLSWRSVDLNRRGASRNPVTPVPASFNQLSGGVEFPLLSGRLRLDGTVADRDAAAAAVVPRAQLGLEFTLSR